jgi:transcription elongation factor Elf1
MKIEHEYTRNIVCPYCGYEDLDSWEVDSGEEDLGIIECGVCGKEFLASRVIDITYCTEKLNDE